MRTFDMMMKYYQLKNEISNMRFNTDPVRFFKLYDELKELGVRFANRRHSKRENETIDEFRKRMNTMRDSFFS